MGQGSRVCAYSEASLLQHDILRKESAKLTTICIYTPSVSLHILPSVLRTTARNACGRHAARAAWKGSVYFARRCSICLRLICCAHTSQLTAAYTRIAVLSSSRCGRRRREVIKGMDQVMGILNRYKNKVAEMTNEYEYYAVNSSLPVSHRCQG